jgi:hypothetical protein
MSLTEPAVWVGKPFEGYMLNAEFSAENAHLLNTLLDSIKKELGEAIYAAPIDSLHITLMDWIAPLITYDVKDKVALFESIKAQYDAVFTNIVKDVKTITINFNEIRVSPSTIFIVGRDDGEFQDIRERFLKKVELLPKTKLPPTIIHASLARFTKPIELSSVKDFIEPQSISITQNVDNFRLVHSKREPLLEYDIIKRYHLH